jgi:maltose alpha-D-glucosyltransferase/alpha-amylase
MINDLWYKNAVIYCLSVSTYLDSDGDGVGDFKGLLNRLDYLQGLGVTAIWLMPFQPSPHRDDGYDIADYYNVDPTYGSLGFRGVRARRQAARDPDPDRSRRESHLRSAPVV